jgi:squalene synthase HpnC
MADPLTLAEAQAHTRRLTFGHYENFPVAGWLIPKHLRQDVCNIYAFARGADDFADEAEYAGERMERLQAWRAMLHGAALTAAGLSTHKTEAPTDHPVFVALTETLRVRTLPVELLNDLITAFMLDVKKTRYAQFGEVMHYCRHSANPVGRLLLHLFGYVNERWMTLSDSLCTALQLANFWQDVAVDLQKNEGAGRIYIPRDDMARCGVTEADLRAGRMTDALRTLMAFQVERAMQLFAAGRSLCDTVPHPRLRWQLRLTWLGGMRICEKIRANDHNIFARPTLRPWDWPLLAWRAISWQSSRAVPHAIGPG